MHRMKKRIKEERFVRLRSSCCYDLFFYKCFDFLINALAVQLILFDEFPSRTGFSKYIIDSNLHYFRTCRLSNYVADCTSK